jgi:Flp pilus assembly protein CpaB
MKQKNIVLMVVAVGCGLVAAFLTAYARSKPVEQVEVIVAVKDLNVGTVFTANEMNGLVKRKSVPKDGLPPTYVTNFDELLDKRLSRPMRAEEAINPADLNKGITLPEGTDLFALPIGAAGAAAGFVPPGSRVDVRATLRVGDKVKVLKLLINTLIINANQDLTNSQKNVYADLNIVGLALTQQEIALVKLAQGRNYELSLTLRGDKRGADADKDYDIEKVFKELSGEQDKVDKPTPTNEGKKPDTTPAAQTTAAQAPPPQEKKPTVKVWVALEDVKPGTPVTPDLLGKAFEAQERDAATTENPLTDFGDTTDKVFVFGVQKGMWLTKTSFGKADPKPAPVYSFNPVKTTEPEAQPTPAAPAVQVQAPKPAKPKTFDITVTGPGGTVVHRFEELPNGKSRKIAELTPEQAAAADKQADAPKAGPEAR